MSLSLTELSVYAFALFLLFLTPGPVWVALTARCLQSGFSGGWPLALGVAVGDCLWPLLALLTLTQFAQIYAELLESLRFLAVAVFLMLGVQLIRAPVVAPEAGGRLTQPGRLTGFIAGVLVILGNPKAILFYLGILPGFFDISVLTTIDITMVVIISALVPFMGNLLFILGVEKARTILTSQAGRRRLNVATGSVLIAVGLFLLAG
ncbi:MAG: LysE family translocator [Candidatus Puniceispirillaceae bacterium]